MAEAKHYKLHRKELRNPDVFQERTAQAADWLRDNQTVVVAVVSAVVAIGADRHGHRLVFGRQAQAASTRLATAESLFEAKKYAEAATEFAAVASEYPSTPSGRLAGLYKARALAAQPDAAAAVTAYNEYLAGSPATDYLRQEALMGLGARRKPPRTTRRPWTRTARPPRWRSVPDRRPDGAGASRGRRGQRRQGARAVRGAAEGAGPGRRQPPKHPEPPAAGRRA
jgi:hypothetical protein